MLPYSLSARELASKLKIPANRISEIVRGRRDVSASTALRLGNFFGTTPELWLNLQSSFDLSKAINELGSSDDLPVMDAE